MSNPVKNSSAVSVTSANIAKDTDLEERLAALKNCKTAVEAQQTFTFIGEAAAGKHFLAETCVKDLTKQGIAARILPTSKQHSNEIEVRFVAKLDK